ncbi:ribosomal L7Ae/L30e/S12e/Gadd45 family protein [Bengtsoniella intestinalis]|uniref:ribosomal L7Ae/L30e/S12e/Gadd45 family protein n=1 Tax=Bengtsoniella intestinalis TaxID=3073143 RepID=UPI00391F3116
MIEELASIDKVIGVKQSRKVLRDGRARKVYLACDADPAITQPIVEACQAQEVAVDMDYSLSQLGLACGITVGAAVVAVLR